MAEDAPTRGSDGPERATGLGEASEARPTALRADGKDEEDGVDSHQDAVSVGEKRKRSLGECVDEKGRQAGQEGMVEHGGTGGDGDGNSRDFNHVSHGDGDDGGGGGGGDVDGDSDENSDTETSQLAACGVLGCAKRHGHPGVCDVRIEVKELNNDHTQRACELVCGLV